MINRQVTWLKLVTPPRFSQEEQESRRAMKRFRRRKVAESLSARQRGQSMGLRRAKAKRKEKRTSGA